MEQLLSGRKSNEFLSTYGLSASRGLTQSAVLFSEAEDKHTL